MMQKFKKACEDRVKSKKDADVELVSVVKQTDTLNPNEVEGKRKFGYDIGAVLSVKYIAEHPPKGCEWMTDKAFVAKVVK